MKEREIEIVEGFERGICVEMNRKALKKVCHGFLRNAIENTPDEGKIEIKVKSEDGLARIDFQDFGTGITSENRKLIFGGFIHTQDTHRYASKKPYFFNAGGSGSDLLRARSFPKGSTLLWVFQAIDADIFQGIKTNARAGSHPAPS